MATGLAGNVCPDHFFVSNIDDCLGWGRKSGLDMLIAESAGLCNRCSPHIKGALAVCVVDTLSGIHTPRKIGPMLKLADVVVITKGDIVSQAEREVFAFNVRLANPRATIIFFNGITGQGAAELAYHLKNAPRRGRAGGPAPALSHAVRGLSLLHRRDHHRPRLSARQCPQDDLRKRRAMKTDVLSLTVGELARSHSAFADFLSETDDGGAKPSQTLRLWLDGLSRRPAYSCRHGSRSDRWTMSRRWLRRSRSCAAHRRRACSR